MESDGFSFSTWGIPLPYLRYARYRNYGNGYVVITSVGVSVVGGDGCVPWGMSVDGICVAVLQCCSSPNALPLDEKSDKYYLYIIYIIILYIVIYKYIIYYFNLPLTSLNHFGTATLQHCNKCNDVDKSERNVGTFGGQIKEWHIRGWTCRSNREFCCKEQQEGNTNRCSLLAIICKWYLLC